MLVNIDHRSLSELTLLIGVKQLHHTDIVRILSYTLPGVDRVWKGHGAARLLLIEPVRLQGGILLEIERVGSIE